MPEIVEALLLLCYNKDNVLIQKVMMSRNISGTAGETEDKVR